MNRCNSFTRHSADLTNILSKFTEKYLHKLDRSSVDSLLKGGKRLVGDLTDLELEYVGFSLVNQLIWVSFSAHNSYLRENQAERYPQSVQEPQHHEPKAPSPNKKPKSVLRSPKKKAGPFVSNILSLPMPPEKAMKEEEAETMLFNTPKSKSPTKKRCQQIRGSSILDLPSPSSILAPETPELLPLDKPPSNLSIPESEQLIPVDKPGSPILTTRLEDGNNSSPSILSNKRQKENRWGMTTSSSLPTRREETLKQGTLQSFLRPSQREDDSAAPVRTKCGRAALEGFECAECREYYKDANLSEEQVKKLLKACSRHRSKEPPPSMESQNERWELEIRDDEDNEMNKTQMGPPLKVRKKRKGSMR